jgi:hypothetical protein
MGFLFMKRTSKVSMGDKLWAIEAYQRGDKTIEELANMIR